MGRQMNNINIVIFRSKSLSTTSASTFKHQDTKWSSHIPRNQIWKLTTSSLSPTWSWRSEWRCTRWCVSACHRMINPVKPTTSSRGKRSSSCSWRVSPSLRVASAQSSTLIHSLTSSQETASRVKTRSPHLLATSYRASRLPPRHQLPWIWSRPSSSTNSTSCSTSLRSNLRRSRSAHLRRLRARSHPSAIKASLMPSQLITRWSSLLCSKYRVKVRQRNSL